MTAIPRRQALAALAGLAALGFAPASAQDDDGKPFGMTLGPPAPFDPEAVVAQARTLAAAAYAPPPEVEQAWRDLSYDQFREIWFDTRHALFRGTGGAAQAEFFVAGLYAGHRIAVHAIEDGVARPVLFETRVFDTTDRFPDLPEDGTGFSGFRLLGELVAPGRFQEYAVFQGASYFRAIARGQTYGLSARGLALNTASGRAEEFPLFRAFWIEAAPPGATSVTVHALLDGPSLAGAYRFVISHGATTVMEVSARLFPRVTLDQVGIAPATSMFLFNDLNPARFDDFREAVHDSDGLLIRNGQGETVWRPLSNPATLETSVFADPGLRGFGLMQRARGAGDYNDLVARYEARPSLWTEPLADWGPGAVFLIEIPTDAEVNDNVVAFWRPETPLAAGREHRFDYRLHWCATAPVEGGVARVIATRSGARAFGEGRIFTIDFEAHPALGLDVARIEARVSAGAGTLSPPLVQSNPATGGLRLDVTLRDAEDRPAELRAELWRDGARVSEVWLFRWTPA